MNTKSYDQKDLHAYLLGAMADARAEQFDELSFTDEQFAAALEAAENDLVDSYARGRLSGETLERFESKYLASPLRREKVAFAAAFQDFAEKAAAQNAFAAAPQENEKLAQQIGEKGLFARLSERLSANMRLWQFGFAAAILLLMLTGGWFYLENARLRADFDETLARQSELERGEKALRDRIAAETDQSAKKENELNEIRAELARLEAERRKEAEKTAAERRELQEKALRAAEERAPGAKNSPPAPPAGTIAFFALVPQLRGGNLPALSVPPNAAAVALRLELEPFDFSVYRVALKNQSDGRVLWQSGRLKARVNGDSKALNISFPARLLSKNQTYQLEVTGTDADGKTQPASDYFFRNVR